MQLQEDSLSVYQTGARLFLSTFLIWWGCRCEKGPLHTSGSRGCRAEQKWCCVFTHIHSQNRAIISNDLYKPLQSGKKTLDDYGYVIQNVKTYRILFEHCILAFKSVTEFHNLTCNMKPEVQTVSGTWLKVFNQTRLSVIIYQAWSEITTTY